MALWTEVVAQEKDAREYCGAAASVMGPGHAVKCGRKGASRHHDGTRDDTKAIVDEVLRANGFALSVSEPSLGDIPVMRGVNGQRVPKLDQNAAQPQTVPRRRADLHIRAGSIAGMGKQYIDFCITNARTQR